MLECVLRDGCRRRRYFLLKVERTEAQMLRKSKGVGRDMGEQLQSPLKIA